MEGKVRIIDLGKSKEGPNKETLDHARKFVSKIAKEKESNGLRESNLENIKKDLRKVRLSALTFLVLGMVSCFFSLVTGLHEWGLFNSVGSVGGLIMVFSSLYFGGRESDLVDAYNTENNKKKELKDRERELNKDEMVALMDLMKDPVIKDAMREILKSSDSKKPTVGMLRFIESLKKERAENVVHQEFESLMNEGRLSLK